MFEFIKKFKEYIKNSLGYKSIICYLGYNSINNRLYLQDI